MGCENPIIITIWSDISVIVFDSAILYPPETFFLPPEVERIVDLGFRERVVFLLVLHDIRKIPAYPSIASSTFSRVRAKACDAFRFIVTFLSIIVFNGLDCQCMLPFVAISVIQEVELFSFFQENA